MQYLRDLRKKKQHAPADFRDVRRSAKPRVVLRERALKIEVSWSSLRAFLLRHKAASISITLLVTLLISWRAMTGFATTASFYPSSCLGSWNGVQNALGHPDLGPGSSASQFSTGNSAVLSANTGQMFCGNFAGDTDISALEAKSFEHADLVLSWTFVFPGNEGVSADASSSSASSTDVAGTTTTSSGDASSSIASSTDETSGGASSTDVSNADDSADTSGATSAPAAPPSSDTAASSTGVAAPASNSTPAAGDSGTASPSSVSSGGSSSSGDSGSTSASAPAAPAPAASSGDNSSAAGNAGSASQSSAPAPAATPAPAPAPAPVVSPPASSDGSSPGADSPSSFINNFFKVAYAQDLPSDDTSTVAADSSTVPVADVSSSDATASGTEENNPTTTSELSVDTSVFQNITVPSSSAQDILNISYSTNGVNWSSLANVNAGNWQTVRYEIPIHSWDELEHLQVAFVGLGTTAVVPQVYLDGMTVEAKYHDPEEQPQPFLVDKPRLPPPSPSPIKEEPLTFDARAQQTCDVQPFSRTVAPGDQASFTVTLHPSGKPHLPFTLALGDLPGGITGLVTPSSTNPLVQTISLSSAQDTAAGSYNTILLYKEIQTNGTMLPNYCQFNLTVE